MLAIIPRTNEERNKTLKFPPRFKLIYAKQASPFLLTEIMVLFYTSVLIHSFIHSFRQHCRKTQQRGHNGRGTRKGLLWGLAVCWGKGNKKQVYYTLEEEA